MIQTSAGEVFDIMSLRGELYKSRRLWLESESPLAVHNSSMDVTPGLAKTVPVVFEAGFVPWSASKLPVCVFPVGE